MSSTNSVVLCGRLTRKPELKSFDGGGKLATVGIAVNDTRKDANGDYVEEVSFFDLKVFGRQAEVMEEYLDKGRQIVVTGKLKQESWETEGKKNSKVVVIVNNFEMIGAKPVVGESEGEEVAAGNSKKK